MFVVTDLLSLKRGLSQLRKAGMETCQGGHGQAGEVGVGWSWVVASEKINIVSLVIKCKTRIQLICSIMCVSFLRSELGRPALNCCPSEPLWILS